MEIKAITPWSEVLDSARITIHKKPLNKEPSDKFKKRLIIAEESPIYTRWYRLDDQSCNRRVALHLIRHHIGTQPFLGTTREDIIDTNGEVIPFRFYFNLQSLINMAEERLCFKAYSATRHYVVGIIQLVAELESFDFAPFLVPMCVKRGYCPKSDRGCSFIDTSSYISERADFLRWVESC